jgi:PadR family transcriptional regulator PadR
MPSGDNHVELLQGTLDLIILRALSTMGPLHAYALATRLAQVSDHPLSLNQGTLYPALVRMEQKGWIKGTWGRTEANREAKFYSLTRAGGRALAKQAERWRRLAGLVDTLLLEH